jgi:hypothetical protein
MHITSARATFTFTGTGFDIISLCSAQTGVVMVNVYKGKVTNFDDPPWDDYVASYIVDTYFGYRYDSTNKKWVIDPTSESSLYQVPVIKADLTKVMTVMDDPNTQENEAQYKNWGYGTYSVEIYVAPSFVEGEHAYEVEFDFADGEIRNLICSCPCGYTCKHEVAAMMQLKETLELIEKHYADLHHGYFAAVVKGDMFQFAIDSHETGSFTL